MQKSANFWVHFNHQNVLAIQDIKTDDKICIKFVFERNLICMHAEGVFMLL